MAAGDLITADWQWELDGLLFGPGTDITIRRNVRGSLAGLGALRPDNQDVDLAHADGVFAGTDHKPLRLITWALQIVKDTEAAAINRAFEVAAVFDATSDKELHGQLPGKGRIYLTGRPNGAEMDLRQTVLGIVELFAEFRATDPTINEVV